MKQGPEDPGSPIQWCLQNSVKRARGGYAGIQRLQKIKQLCVDFFFLISKQSTSQNGQLEHSINVLHLQCFFTSKRVSEKYICETQQYNHAFRTNHECALGTLNF